LLAIWRAAAAKPAHAVCLMNRGSLGSGLRSGPSSATERRPARLPRPAGRRGIAAHTKPVGTRLAREAEHAVCQAYREVSFAGEPRSNKVYARRTDASAEGVGAQLARDLARSGSKTCARGASDEPRKFGFGAAQRPHHPAARVRTYREQAHSHRPSLLRTA